MAEEKERGTYYRVDCFMKVEPEKPTIYEYYWDARIDFDQLELMHPDNYYELNKCDKDGNDLE